MYNNWKIDFKNMCSRESGAQPPATTINNNVQSNTTII
jgi:hypothetical protein